MLVHKNKCLSIALIYRQNKSKNANQLLPLTPLRSQPHSPTIISTTNESQRENETVSEASEHSN